MIIEGRLELGSHIFTIYSKNGNLFEVQCKSDIPFDDNMEIVKKFVESLNRGSVQYIIEPSGNEYICEKYSIRSNTCAVLKTRGSNELEALDNNVKTKDYLDRLL